jgi:hypothetical protein
MSAYEDAEARDGALARRLKALGKAAGVDPERLTILSGPRRR